MHIILCALMLVACLATELRAEPIEINEGSVLQLRSSLMLLTPKPHIVSPILWEACAVARPVQVGVVDPTGTGPRVAQASTKEMMRAGPHAQVAVNFYVNQNALGLMGKPERQFPVGTIVVKEKLSPSGAVNAVTGMVKRSSGFDQDHGDWEYFYSDKLSGFTMGRIANCVQCHAKAKSKDYVYTLKGPAVE